MHPQSKYSLPLLLAIIFLSRIPFIFSGYGSEEDAWGLILIARNIAATGVYEVSRLPGHPVQGLLLTLIWQWPSWLLNLLTVLFSTAGIAAFMLALKKLLVQNYLYAGALLAAVPVIYINNTNVMDYTWALSLTLFSLYAITHKKYVLAGTLLGLACGFRITAGAMAIPFALIIWGQELRFSMLFRFAISIAITTIICYIPAWMVYGKGFFTYYEYFPYPPFLKNIYKATIGAWGIPGMVALITGVWFSLRKLQQTNSTNLTHKYLLVAAVITILLYSYSFIKIPQKSAFVIPMVPYIILIFVILCKEKQLKWITMLMILSCFFAGIQLDDKLRGSTPTFASMPMQIGNTNVTFDLLQGPVSADDSKRKNKIAYAKQIATALSEIKNPTVLIAGWWQNEVNYFRISSPNPQTEVVYYIDEATIKDYQDKGYQLFFLPEQDFYNDLRFKGKFTITLAKPF
ncbi:MAG: hypothetical protein IPK08_07515 [Bacteroidetes bacterium]|nr:hypothetical protein [Bacteroidota bacterium]